ncbi:MAG: efflux RND transporter periplasmic adaptor subunit [Alphaproteobacteria bacterium]|nr:efflux RND transporter periplasmic adaptor subunit [Alphaproteobacteria bacterium]
MRPRFLHFAHRVSSRQALVSAFIALTLLAVGLSACDDQRKKQAAAPAPPPVTVAKPVVKDIVEWDEFTGRFDAVAAVEIRARVSGYLAAVHFTDGALVKEGAPLFVIDRRPYQAILAQAEANITSARTSVELARQELDRAERLMRTGNTTEQVLDTRRQQSAAAVAHLAAAQAAADQARLDLSFTEIKAPISGRISRKLVTEGNLVSANSTLLTTIVAVDPMHFYFDVDERSFMAYLRMAREANGNKSDRELRHDVQIQLPDERRPRLKGRLDFVDNRIDAATGTMRVRAIVANDDLLIVPGLFGRVLIPGSPLYKGVLIPDEAIVTDQDRRMVYVVAADGAVAPRVIRPGPRIDGYRVVRQGLTAEETIVVNGVQRVRLGGKVTPQLAELPPSR